MGEKIRVSAPIAGQKMAIRDAFTAVHFGEQEFSGLIDPVVMLDHFRMSGPTFEPHPHAGISAVTYVFEDSAGAHYNYDSLGNQGPIEPGALHWFVAGRGAVHTEKPQNIDRHVHALQIFVNLPASKKLNVPRVVHVEANEIPEYGAPGVRVRVVTGSFKGVAADCTAYLPEPFDLLDSFLDQGAVLEHALSPGWNMMTYVVSGMLRLEVAQEDRVLTKSTAMGVSVPIDATSDVVIRLKADEDLHVVLLSGPALNEPIAKHGPLVMNTPEQVYDRLRAYQRNEFGQLKLDGCKWRIE